MIPESQIFNLIRSGKLSLPPVNISLVNNKNARSNDYYALIKITWQKQSFTFATIIKRYSSNRVVQEAVREAKYAAKKLNKFPLIITPWLSPEQLSELDATSVSGIDLSGNGIITIPGKLSIFRSGQPNAFPQSRLVKNVYQGSSSLVARVFLLKPVYTSVQQIVEEIETRGGFVTQPTVSKALKQLEEDVIIWRDKNEIKLVQPDKLLDRLAANYKRPHVLSELSFKFESD
jgi:hypothetical protein